MKMIKLSAIALILIVVLLGLFCLENVPVEVKKSLVKVVLEGLDNEVEFVLPAGQYIFQAELLATGLQSNITVTCYDLIMNPITQAEFTLPNAEIGTKEGDSASTDAVGVTVTGGNEVTVVLEFEFPGQIPDGWVRVSLGFTSHPDIGIITMIPGFDWHVSSSVEIIVGATNCNGNTIDVSVQVEITDQDGNAQAMATLTLNGGSGKFEGTIDTPGLADDYTITITVFDHMNVTVTQVARAITIVP